MRKLTFLLVAAAIFLSSALLTACGSGVDQSDPKVVAEKALECYHKGDYVQLKTLVDPADEASLSEMDNMIEMAKEFAAKYPDKKPEPVDFTFKEVKDGLTGGELTDDSSDAKVVFDSEKWPHWVMLVKVDGKWYFERFK